MKYEKKEKYIFIFIFIVLILIFFIIAAYFAFKRYDDELLKNITVPDSPLIVIL